MRYGYLWNPNDEMYVSLAEGLRNIDTHIAEHGTIHDNVSSYQSPFLRDHVPGWSVWAPRDINDAVWGKIVAFYKDRALFAELCEEGGPTEIMTRYGLKVGLSSWEVQRFKDRIAEHKRAQIVPIYREHVELSGVCWLCGLEREHGN